MATEPIHPTKSCTKCGVEKPFTNEFFPPNGSGKLRWRCRPCWREYEREYFWANREAKRAAKKRHWAKCDKAAARDRVKQWKAANPDKARAIDLRRLERIKASPVERAKAVEKMRRWRLANPEKAAAAIKRRKERHPDASAKASRRYRERHLEKVKAKERRYRQENPERVIAHSEKRRARLLAAPGEFSAADVAALFKRSRGCCYYCSDKLEKFEVDHFIPLSRGGSNWPDNLVISCRSCNLSKSAKMPWEWQPDRFGEGQTPY